MAAKRINEARAIIKSFLKFFFLNIEINPLTRNTINNKNPIMPKNINIFSIPLYFS